MSGISAQYVDGLEFRIKELREQVEKLTKERDIKEHCIVQLEAEDLRAKEQLAALAEQSDLVRAEENEAIIAAANALENIASTSSSTRLRRIVNDTLAAINEVLYAAPTPPVIEERWQPIETAPKYGRFLAVMPSGVMSVVVWLEASHPDADGEGWYEHWKFDPVDPSHWMPLPEAPAAIDALKGE